MMRKKSWFAALTQGLAQFLYASTAFNQILPVTSSIEYRKSDLINPRSHEYSKKKADEFFPPFEANEAMKDLINLREKLKWLGVAVSEDGFSPSGFRELDIANSLESLIIFGQKLGTKTEKMDGDKVRAYLADIPKFGSTFYLLRPNDKIVTISESEFYTISYEVTTAFKKILVQKPQERMLPIWEGDNPITDLINNKTFVDYLEHFDKPTDLLMVFMMNSIVYYDSMSRKLSSGPMDGPDHTGQYMANVNSFLDAIVPENNLKTFEQMFLNLRSMIALTVWYVNHERKLNTQSGFRFPAPTDSNLNTAVYFTLALALITTLKQRYLEPLKHMFRIWYLKPTIVNAIPEIKTPLLEVMLKIQPNLDIRDEIEKELKKRKEENHILTAVERKALKKRANQSARKSEEPIPDAVYPSYVPPAPPASDTSADEPKEQSKDKEHPRQLTGDQSKLFVRTVHELIARHAETLKAFKIKPHQVLQQLDDKTLYFSLFHEGVNERLLMERILSIAGISRKTNLALFNQILDGTKEPERKIVIAPNPEPQVEQPEPEPPKQPEPAPVATPVLNHYVPAGKIVLIANRGDQTERLYDLQSEILRLAKRITHFYESSDENRATVNKLVDYRQLSMIRHGMIHLDFKVEEIEDMSRIAFYSQVCTKLRALGDLRDEANREHLLRVTISPIEFDDSHPLYESFSSDSAVWRGDHAKHIESNFGKCMEMIETRFKLLNENPSEAARQMLSLQIGEIYQQLRNSNGFHDLLNEDPRCEPAIALRNQIAHELEEVLDASNKSSPNF